MSGWQRSRAWPAGQEGPLSRHGPRLPRAHLACAWRDVYFKDGFFSAFLIACPANRVAFPGGNRPVTVGLSPPEADKGL